MLLMLGILWDGKTGAIEPAHECEIVEGVNLGDAGPVLPAVVDVGASGAMVDEVLERARQARTQERATWP